MTYQSSAFGGVGGFRSNALNKILSADNGFASQETLFFGLTIDVPASLAGNSYIFTLGTSNTISTGAQFYIDTVGRIRYSTNQAGGQANFGGDLRGGRHALLFNFTAFDNCDVYVDSVDSPLASLDLSNTYAFQNDLMFGGGSTSTLDYGLFFAKLGSHDAVNDPSLASIMTDLKTKFNIA